MTTGSAPLSRIARVVALVGGYPQDGHLRVQLPKILHQGRAQEREDTDERKIETAGVAAFIHAASPPLLADGP
jgi:hypothetical protein